MHFRPAMATAASALALLLLGAGVGQAKSLALKADLAASAETPPNDAKGTGSLTGTFDTDTKMLSWSVSYSGLSGPATAAHFHAPAPVGKAAGVEVPIKGELTSPITGSTTLSDEQAKNLTDGMTYFNIHTAANKGGEIRGQVAAGK